MFNFAEAFTYPLWCYNWDNKVPNYICISDENF